MELPEHGVNDAETRSTDVRLFLHKTGAFFGVINEQFNTIEVEE